MNHSPDAYPTAAECVAAHRLLEESRDALVQLTQRLGPEDWLASDGPGRWNVAGVLEHLTIAEGRMPQVFEATLAQPAPPDWREQTAGQDAKMPGIAVVTQKIEAPPVMHPTASRTPVELLRDFTRDRNAMIAWAERTDVPLKQHLRLHPVFGQLSLYQWLLAIGYHTQRHTSQMRRILEPRTSA